jgi:hypothetical protein
MPALSANSELNNHLLKMQKRFVRSFLMPETGKNLLNHFYGLNDSCSAQGGPGELKLVSLIPPRNEDYEYDFLNFSSMSVNKTAIQNVRQLMNLVKMIDLHIFAHFTLKKTQRMAV